MRFFIIAVIVLIPLLSLLSLLQPLLASPVEHPIGPAFTMPETDTADAARGQGLYQSKCYGCHVPAAKLGPAPDSADFTVRYADDEAIFTTVRAGRQPMPAFTDEMLSDQEIADIIAYIRSLPMQ